MRLPLSWSGAAWISTSCDDKVRGEPRSTPYSFTVALVVRTCSTNARKRAPEPDNLVQRLAAKQWRADLEECLGSRGCVYDAVGILEQQDRVRQGIEQRIQRQTHGVMFDDRVEFGRRHQVRASCTPS